MNTLTCQHPILYGLIFFLGMLYLPLSAQHDAPKSRPAVVEEESDKRFRLGLFIGYTLVPSGKPAEGQGGLLIAPTIGLDFDIWIAPRFAIGTINDLELTTYVVDNEELGSLTREYVFITTLVAAYELNKNFLVFAGPGYEYERNQSFFVARFGTEYNISTRNDWILGVTSYLDFKFRQGSYSSLTLGVVVGRKL